VGFRRCQERPRPLATSPEQHRWSCPGLLECCRQRSSGRGAISGGSGRSNVAPRVPPLHPFSVSGWGVPLAATIGSFSASLKTDWSPHYLCRYAATARMRFLTLSMLVSVAPFEPVDTFQTVSMNDVGRITAKRRAEATMSQPFATAATPSRGV